MATLTQLDRFYPSLSAKERARMVLQAWKERRDEDRLVRSTMPERQVREFNRSIGIMNGANEKLGVYLLWLQAMSDQIGLRLGWLLSMLIQETDWKDDLRRKGGRRRNGKWSRDLTEQLGETIRSGLTERWHELRAVEIVVEEAGQELEVELFIPEVQTLAADIRARLLGIHSEIERLGYSMELTEPDAEKVYQARSVIEAAIEKALA